MEFDVGFEQNVRTRTEVPLSSPCPRPALALPSPSPRPALAQPSPCPRPALALTYRAVVGAAGAGGTSSCGGTSGY
jgi:hypothetical protein